MNPTTRAASQEPVAKAGGDLRVFRLGWPVSNVWLLPETPDGPILVDSGFHTHWVRLLLGLKKLGVNPKNLKGIILTHRHVDHAGNAGRLASLYGIPVYAHKADAVYLRGDASNPPLPQTADFVGALSLIENRFPARVPGTISIQEGDKVAGLEVFSMPGHTLGSIFLFHRESGTMFTGDGLLNAVPPLVTRTALSLPFAAYCDDYPTALESLRRFVEMDLSIKRICPGHGPLRPGPVCQDVGRMLEHVTL